MRKKSWLLIAVLTVCLDFGSASQQSAKISSQTCRIVDVVSTSYDDAYVDGFRVSEKLGLLNSLRQREKSSTRSCLRVFVPITGTIQEIEDLRVIAGKMQYKDFHVYIYEKEYRDSVSEMAFGLAFNADELRSAPTGSLPWPDRQHSRQLGRH